MNKILSLLIVLAIFGIKTAYGQNLIANPKSTVLTVKKTNGTDLILPVEVDFINQSSNTIVSSVTLQIDNATAPPVSRFTPAEFTSLKTLNANQTISLNANETKKATNTFYLIIDTALEVNYDKIIYLKFTEGATQLCSIKVNIQSDEKILTLDDYLEKDIAQANRVNKLDDVTKVESNNNILTISGFKKITATDNKKQDLFLKRTVGLNRGKVFAVTEWSWVFNSFHWKPIPISIITVPFKVRPSVTAYGKVFDGSATSGISNVGFNLDLGKVQMDRYFSNGKKSTHKFSIGILATPSVEELDSVFTNGANGKLGKVAGKMEKSKQLFLSTGITISYSYNDISFVFVPVGIDYGTSTIGKTWVYNKQRWWGFGIAISPKIFATIFSK